jgi:hypothetical protein
MKWPADRTLTDTQRKILDSWLGGLKILEPFLAYSAADFVTLQALIRAAQEATPEDPFSLSAAIGALTVDDEPDLDADYAVTYIGSTAYRTLLSAISRGKTLISSTNLAGLSGVTMAVPLGFTDVEVRFDNIDPSAGTNPRIKFSEDGGANYLTQEYQIFSEG